jgi:hypothetical protein
MATDPTPASPFSSPSSPATSAAATSLGLRAARLSWRLALAVVIAQMLLSIVMVSARTILFPLAIFGYLVGLVCGVFALLTYVRRPVRGLVLPAVVGIGLNAAILCVFGCSFVVVVATVKQIAAAQQREREIEAAFTQYPGWLGVLDRTNIKGDGGLEGFDRTNGARILFASLHDDSPFAKSANAGLTKKVSWVSVSVFGPARDTLKVDLSSLTENMRDGSSQRLSIPLEKLPKADKEKFFELLGAPFQLSAGARKTWAAPVPYGLDLAKVVSVGIVINDGMITVPVRYLTVEEKNRIRAAAAKAGSRQAAP